MAMLGVRAGSAQADLPVIYNGVLRLRPRQPDREPARRQRLELQTERRPPAPGRPRPRHLRRHVEQLAGDLAAAEEQRLLRLRAQLRRLQRQRRDRRLRRRRHPASAGELNAFVDKVLAATGAAEVDLVGHSQGGMMPRYYLKFLGGAAEVHTLVGLSPSNHGTTLDGLSILASFFPGATSSPAPLPRLRAAARRLGLHHRPQRRRRDRAPGSTTR